MAMEIIVSLSDMDEKLVKCWVGDFDAWVQNAVATKLRALTARTLDGALGAENPDWSLDNLLSQQDKAAVQQALSTDLSSAVSGRPLSPEHPVVRFILGAAALPSREEREQHGRSQR